MVVTYGLVMYLVMLVRRPVKERFHSLGFFHFLCSSFIVSVLRLTLPCHKLVIADAMKHHKTFFTDDYQVEQCHVTIVIFRYDNLNNVSYCDKI